MMRAGRNAKEIMIPKIEVSGLGDYTRNMGYKTSSINYAFETKTFNYDRGIRLMADVMDVEEAGVLDCFVKAGAELQRTQVAPEADASAFTFSFSGLKDETGTTGATGPAGPTGPAGTDGTTFTPSSPLSLSNGVLSIDLSSYATQTWATQQINAAIADLDDLSELSF